MGKALYRKHRSKSFDEVIGQSHITDTLKNAINKGAVAHAYLFTGPRGVGKTSIARILAHAINDLPYTDESTHLDIIEIDAASNRRIDEIRELRDKVHIAPISAKYKVYIIDEVHMLTREAFNALLKTLEEPPEHVVFILATTEAHKIPDTIISRTQRFTFKPIDTETAVTHLKNIAKRENIPVQDDALELIAKHGNGSFRDSISMLDQLSGLAKDTYDASDVSLLLGLPNQEVVEAVVQSLAKDDCRNLFETIRTMKEQGIDASEAAKAISQSLREQLLINNAQILDRRTILAVLKELLPLTAGNTDYTALELALLSGIDFQFSKQPEPSSTTSVQTPPHTPADPKTNIGHKDDAPTGYSGPANHNLHINTSADSPPAAETIDNTPQARVVQATEKPQAQKPRNSSEPQESQTPVASDEPVDDTFSAAPFTSDGWNMLLDDIKSHHNTLYGVLRMANASFEEGKIVLNFSYGFHKKRIDAPQNNTIIRKFFKKHFGSAEFVTTVAKSEKIAAPSKTSHIEEPTANPDVAISSVSNIFGGAELLES